jgi:hypothetical protein
MFKSHVIEVNGTFIGAAVPMIGGFRFRAVHPQVEELDDFCWTSLDELRQATGCFFRTGRHATATQATNAILAQQPEPPYRPSPAAPWTSR